MATKYELLEEESVEGRMKGLLGSSSPYLEAARSRGKQVAAERGLLNTSIAAGASEAAAIESALPIAQQDAGYLQERGLATQAGDIQTGHYLTQGDISSRLMGEEYGYMGTASEQEAEQARRLSAQEFEQTGGLLGTEYGLKGVLSAQEAAQTGALLGTEYGLKGKLLGTEYGYMGGLSAQEAKQAGKLSAQEAGQSSKLLGEEYGYMGGLSAQEAGQTSLLSVQEAEQALVLQGLIEDSKMEIAQLEYDAIMAELDSDEATALAAAVTELSVAYQNNMADIMADPTMTSSEMDAALADLQDQYYADLELIYAIYGYDSDFEDGGGGGGGGGDEDFDSRSECEAYYKPIMDAALKALEACFAAGEFVAVNCDAAQKAYDDAVADYHACSHLS